MTTHMWERSAFVCIEADDELEARMRLDAFTEAIDELAEHFDFDVHVSIDDGPFYDTQDEAV